MLQRPFIHGSTRIGAVDLITPTPHLFDSLSPPVDPYSKVFHLVFGNHNIMTVEMK